MVVFSCTSRNFLPEEFKDETYITHLKKTNDSIHVSASVYYFTPDINFRVSRKYYWLDKDSIIQTNSNFSGKLLHGVYEEFYPNDQLSVKGHYKNGIKRGNWFYWNDTGQLLRKEKWWFWGRKLRTKYYGTTYLNSPPTEELPIEEEDSLYYYEEPDPLLQ